MAGAAAIEAAVGYPGWLYGLVRHPVVWMGALIGALERAWNRPTWPGLARRVAGVAALLVVLGISVGIAGLLQAWLGHGMALVLPMAAASALPAQRSLHQHVARVREGLAEGGLAEGRRAVSQIVGRDPESLDEAGVARAAIESLAENFADGVVAPLLWGVLAGLPGMVGYKAVNTADSMIGHRTARFEAFGWAAARVDDVVNLPASRLAALWLIAAAALTGELAGAAWRAVWRDAGRHRSPNAGWPEAAMAGALGLRLAGPRVYDGRLVADGWMGHGREQATADDIGRALRLYRVACGLELGALIAASALVR